MKKLKGRILISILIIVFLLTGCGAKESSQKDETAVNDQSAVEAVDQEEKVTDPNADERIIAATVAIVEFMEALNIDLVGVPTTYKDLPARYDNATEIGNPMWPDMEIVMSLKPTNIFTVTTLQDDLEEDFKKIKAPATFLNLQSVDSMLAEIEAIGNDYHRSDEAKEFVSNYKAKMAAIEDNIEVDTKPKVLILMGIPGSYIIGTEHSYIGDLVERAGGQNAVTDREEEYISGNTEYLQQLDADIILRAAHGAPQEVIKMFDKEFAENDIWKHFKAVKEERVYDLEETRFGTTANLEALQALEELIEMLHHNK